MGRFDKYRVELKGLKTNTLEMEFDLDNGFFADIEGEEFQRGAVKACVGLRKNRDVFDFTFDIKGTVIVPCDRCLDDLEVEVDTVETLRVRLGDSFADDGDVVVVPESDGEINIAWYLYEFIVLALPMKRVHAPGKCNREMTGKLKTHGTVVDDEADDDEPMSEAIDPRWESLKSIQIEDN